MLEIKLYDKKTGEFETIKQGFISLKHVFKWLEFEENIAESFAKQEAFEKYVKAANDGEDMDDVPVPETAKIPKSTDVLRGRLELIADLFDDKRVTVESLMDKANATDKLIPMVQTYVMDQYSSNDESGTASKN